jgi:glycosyltransferase involved in cell wall biosynthesis
VVDPAAYTPPYDHALCSALGRAGAEVTLFTSAFAYGDVPAAAAYARRELFYRTAFGSPGSRLRAAVKLAEHVPDMLRYRRLARAADVAHFQWLPVQHLDGHLLPSRRTARRAHGARPALVLTAHDILPREPRPGQRSAQRRLYERFDAIVVHSAHGRERLTGALGVDPARVHVILHGALPLDESGGPPARRPAPGEQPLVETPALPGKPPQTWKPGPPFGETDLPVVLFFGLLRPYKGLDLLLQAWRGIEDAQLWIVGMPRMDVSGLREAARSLGSANVSLLTRFVSEEEMAGCFDRADLLVLPYREADQSGVAATALGAGVPMLLSDVGGFPELARTGAARTFPAGDPAALHAALAELLADPAKRAQMAEHARAAAAGPYSWAAIARRTLELYEALLGEDEGP